MYVKDATLSEIGAVDQESWTFFVENRWLTEYL